MSDFNTIYSQFGTGNTRDKSALERVYKNPGAYTQSQVRDIYTRALTRPTANNIAYDDKRYFRDIGSDDEDWVSIPGALTTAQNRYDSQLNALVGGAQSPVFARQAAELQATAKRSQEDIARQLQILSEEKSAISKMTQEYTALMKRDAEARAKAAEDAKIAARTGAANRLREGASANLQIQGAGSTPRTGGTQQFRKRPLQQGDTPSYGGLSKIKSGMVNL